MANALSGPAADTLQRPALQQELRGRRGLYRSVEAAGWLYAVVGMRQYTVSEKIAVCESDPNEAVTVTVEVTGWKEVTMEEDPPQPLSRLADSGQHTYGQQKKQPQAPPFLPGPMHSLGTVAQING
jgi:hypothetical protein